MSNSSGSDSKHAQRDVDHLAAVGPEGPVGRVAAGASAPPAARRRSVSGPAPGSRSRAARRGPAGEICSWTSSRARSRGSRYNCWKAWSRPPKRWAKVAGDGASSNNRTSDGRNSPYCWCKRFQLRRASPRAGTSAAARRRSPGPGGTAPGSMIPSKASGVRTHCSGGFGRRGRFELLARPVVDHRADVLLVLQACDHHAGRPAIAAWPRGSRRR